MKRQILLTLTIIFISLIKVFPQKSSANRVANFNAPLHSSVNCPLVVSIQDNNSSALCSELLKTLVAVTSACTDTNAVSYRWSSSVGGVFSTLRTTTFNLPEFLVATPVTFTVWVKEGSDSLSANYTITVKPRPNRPGLTPVGTIVLCDNNPITLTSSACTGASTNVWSNGVTGVTSISVPAIGGTYFKVACEKNGCVSDSTAAAALITGLVTSPPITTDRIICEGTPITVGNGLQAQLANCGNGATGTYTYTGGTVGYDQGYINTGGTDPTVTVPSTSNVVKKVSISITWRKQKGGFQNDCGTGDFLSWPFHNETQFRIKSPSGKIITLVYAGTYGGIDNPTVTTIFEDGGVPVNSYSPPVSGTFAPAQPLSGFIGENPSGTWTLLPYDNFWRDPLCVSGFALTLSEAQNGTITWWDAPSGGNQVGTGSEFIPTNTAAGTYTYYVQGQCVRGCPSVRSTANLTIKPTPTAPTVSINVPEVNGVRSVCYGESVTLTASGCNNGTINWEYSFSASDRSGSGIASGSTYTFTPIGGTSYNTSYVIKAICEGINLCRSGYSSPLALTVKYKPSAPSITGPGSAICSNSLVTLTASGCYGGTVGWTGNRSGNSINFSLTNTVNVKAACTVSGCTSDSSNVYTITLLPRPATPTVNASQVQALCYGASVNLTANCINGTTVKWTGGLTGSPITVTPLSTRSYRASCLGTNGCASDSSTALNIVVLPKTKPIITGNSFVCGISSVTLNATGCSGVNETVMWRDESTGTTFTETISQTKTFRAVCIRNGYCVSDSSDIFTVQYRVKPSQPTITPPPNTTVCQGTSITLTASACAGGTLGWTGGLSGQTVSVSPNGAKNYRVACLVNGCLSDSSNAVLITVNPSPNITVISNKSSVCTGDTVTLTVAGCTGSILWSTGAINPIIKVSPIINTNYTATCTLGSCSTYQQININPLVAPSVTASGLLQCGQTVTLIANNVPSGSNIQWRKDGVDIVGATNTTLMINSAGSYDFTSYSLVNSGLISNSFINDIKFVDKQRGFFVSGDGIYRTIDGGVTWNKVFSSNILNSITFINSTTALAVGSQGLVLKTIDGGNTWSSIYINNYSYLRKAIFRDVNNGIIVGGFSEIFYTNNGGINWYLASGANLSSVPSYGSASFVPNSSKVYAISSNVLMMSTDNGVNWSQVSVYGNASYNDITFSSTNNGWIVGSGGILLKSIDGGSSWQSQVSGTTKSLVAVQFLNNQVGFACGNSGTTLIKTIDSGNTWQSLNTSAWANSLSFLDENTGWMSYNSTVVKYSSPQCPTTPLIIAPPQRPNAPAITPPTNNTICQGTSITLSATGCTGGTFAWTGGVTGYSISVSPSATKAYKVACTLNTCTSDSSAAVSINVTPAPVFILSSNKISICSGDSATLTVSGCTGSISWSNGETTSVIKVAPATNTTYTATCTLGSCSANQSISTTVLSAPSVTASGLLQCGQTVTLTANNVPAGSTIQWRKDGVDIVGATNGTVVVNSAGNYDFKVGAKFSFQLQISNISSLSDIRFVDLNNGYVFNANNLWKTINGGTNWVNVYSHTSNFEDVYFIDSNNGWAITQQNILKTTNGGLNWTIYNNYWSGVTLSKITFKNLNTGIIITNDGRSLSTTNGGVTWTLNANPVESNVSSWQFKKLLYIPNTNNILLAYRSNGTTLVKLIKSIDNGISWTTISFPNVSYFSGLEDISFVDSNNGWLVGYEYEKLLMKTIDGGNTWTRLNPIMSSGSYNKIDFISPQIGYVQGFDNLTYTNRIYKTKDGGSTWSTFRNIDDDNPYINTLNIRIDFISEDNGWYIYLAANIFQYILKKASTSQCPTTSKVIPNNCCNGLETIKSGSWTDPTTWSCNRVPTSTDDVFINADHTITDTGNILRAKSLNYRGGILKIAITTNLRLVNP
ncbi:MAG: YCF48-related protein [Bacteroidota bacterium]